MLLNSAIAEAQAAAVDKRNEVPWRKMQSCSCIQPCVATLQIEQAAVAQLGSIAFVSNLLRHQGPLGLYRSVFTIILGLPKTCLDVRMPSDRKDSHLDIYTSLVMRKIDP